MIETRNSFFSILKASASASASVRRHRGAASIRNCAFSTTATARYSAPPAAVKAGAMAIGASSSE